MNNNNHNRHYLLSHYSWCARYLFYIHTNLQVAVEGGNFSITSERLVICPETVAALCYEPRFIWPPSLGFLCGWFHLSTSQSVSPAEDDCICLLKRAWLVVWLWQCNIGLLLHRESDACQILQPPQPSWLCLPKTCDSHNRLLELPYFSWLEKECQVPHSISKSDLEFIWLP